MEGHEEQLKENKENNYSREKMSAKERMQAYRARLKANKAQHDKQVMRYGSSRGMMAAKIYVNEILAY
ncbi:hypothetical protein RRG08_013175 [Elysia crispata]|uniref:Uncharacterized protein n=1 Tax=Elysia crispata TaxID=231223 RepID=A0AAE1A0X8_9GAST|nr:hypothetical protein RRG08_013175 [Elysia crispata]